MALISHLRCLHETTSDNPPVPLHHHEKLASVPLLLSSCQSLYRRSADTKWNLVQRRPTSFCEPIELQSMLQNGEKQAVQSLTIEEQNLSWSRIMSIVLWRALTLYPLSSTVSTHLVSPGLLHGKPGPPGWSLVYLQFVAEASFSTKPNLP